MGEISAAGGTHRATAVTARRRRDYMPRFFQMPLSSVCCGALLYLASLPALLAGELKWNEAPGYRWAELEVRKGAAGFTLLKSNEMGVDWINAIKDDSSLNGAGVALGDFDGDGWCDLYFTALHGRHPLFKNLGNFRFKDVSAGSVVEQENQYGKGACFVDLNGDRNLDLVVTAMLDRNVRSGGLKCFLGDGKGRFTDTSESAGMASNLGSHTIAAADVDGNGTMDLYVCNLGTSDRDETKLGYFETLRGKQIYSWVRYNADGRVVERIDLPIERGRPVVPPEFADRLSVDESGEVKELGAPDLLLLGDGHGKFTRASWTDGRFVDEAGKPLTQPPLDFGLAATLRDFNNDGAPDIYVCNDFHTPDRLWFGDGKGRFRAAPKAALRSLAFASMGVDVADLNRDGAADFFVVEMLARTHQRRHRQTGSMKPAALRIGEIFNQPQVMRNMLYLNRGDATWAEIANLARVTASEWSWQPIFLDVDLDGWEDIFVSNGYGRDSMDADATAEAKALGVLAPKEQRRRIGELYPVLDVPKVAFRNRGDLTFDEAGARWGLDTPGIGHGVAEADLDNDGDLDLVMNMYRDRPAIYRNNSGAPRLAVRLRGAGGNSQGIGAKITVRTASLPVQSREMFCGGRYHSGGDTQLCFAADPKSQMSLEVVWRSGKRSRIEKVRANRIYEVAEPAEPLPTAEKPSSQ